MEGIDEMRTQQKSGSPPKRPRSSRPPKGQCPQPSVEGEPSYVEFLNPSPPDESPTPRELGIAPPPFRTLKEGRVKPLRMRFDPDKWEWEVDEEYERLRTKLSWAINSLIAVLVALGILILLYLEK